MSYVHLMENNGKVTIEISTKKGSKKDPNRPDQPCPHGCRDAKQSWAGLCRSDAFRCRHGFLYKGHRPGCAPLYPGGYCDC